jgi:hypothetical protein
MEPVADPFATAADLYPATAVPTTPDVEATPQPAPVVLTPEPEPEPVIVPEPEPVRPAEPAFKTISHREMTRAAYRAVPPFSATITRPTSGQPLS